MVLLSGNNVNTVADNPKIKPNPESTATDESDRSGKRFGCVIVKPIADSGKEFAHVIFGFVIHRDLSRPPRLSVVALRVALPPLISAQTFQ
jgi:hypothetical protein